jgi:PAS domain S-box-containing protein
MNAAMIQPGTTTFDPARASREQDLRQLADAVPQLVWIARADGTAEFYNRHWCEYTGTTIADAADQAWLRILHPEDRERTSARWRESVATGTPYETEYRLRRAADGAFRWFLVRALPVRGEGGAVVRWFGTCTDVDAHKRSEAALGAANAELRRTEEALRASEARALDRYAELEQIYRYAPVGLFTFDREYRFRRINERMAEINGLAPEEHLGKSMFEVVPDLAPGLVDVYRPVLERGEAVLGIELHGATPKAPGVPRDWLCSFFPLTTGAGEVAGLIGAVLEVTEAKTAERALRQADRRKTEFLGVLSHELRNPLAPLRNSVYLLERAAPGSAQAVRAREVIRRQTDHLTRLVDDLLDVTRISRGKIALRRERVDLRDVVRSTTDDLLGTCAQAGLALRVDYGSVGPVWIDADPTRIAQVLGNLLQNAVRFTPSGGAIEVALRTDWGRAVLSVQDTGVGMEPATIERMFEPFEQAPQPLERTTGGLGLGLALVRGFVELHGGTVEARSPGAGRGSEFTVRLPIAERPGPVDRPPRATPPTPLRVLVIEDDPDAGDTLADVLALAGHEVTVARTGGDGIALARRHRPGVVLCDIGLPDTDGYEVARALREDPALQGARLVALSGFAQTEDRTRAEAAGFDVHLAKPPDLDELLRVVTAVEPA